MAGHWGDGLLNVRARYGPRLVAIHGIGQTGRAQPKETLLPSVWTAAVSKTLPRLRNSVSVSRPTRFA